MNKVVKTIVKKHHLKDYEYFIKSGIDPLIAKLLYSRGFTKVCEVKKYLNAGIGDLYDASLIKGISKVFDLVKEAIDGKLLIAIFGDYDVDGVTSTAIMYNSLRDLGADVVYRLPDRLTEGYGMSSKAVEELHDKGVDVIITVDNGITCFEQIALAKKYGMKVIVLDHHTPKNELPAADVVIDLHIPGETYPYVDLAGCGLAFKVCCYLYERFEHGDKGLKNIDLAAIGTVADVCELTDENRIIVREGLKILNDENYERIGILELMNFFGIEPQTLTSMDIGFKIAPALNAPGRLLEHGADIALEAVLCSDTDKAVDLAAELKEINDIRKEKTAESLEIAYEYIMANDLQDDKVLVLFLPDVPEGIVGLVAGQLTESYHRPSIVFTEGHSCYKASGRSIEEYNLYEGLCTCADIFLGFGGHKQAAGMSIEKDDNKLMELRRRMNEHANNVLTDEDLVEKIYIDEVVRQSNINMYLIDRISVMEPFGQGNPKPVFYIETFYAKKQQVKLSKDNPKKEWSHFTYMGKDKNHLKVFGANTSAIGFSMAEKFEELKKPINLTITFTLTVNFFMSRKSVQLEIIDFQSAVKDGEKEPTVLMNNMGDAFGNLNSFQKSS